MPLNLRKQANKSLIAQGIRYQILFAFKQDSSKQVFKALRKDEHTGIQQEVLLKIFLDKKESYKEEFESLSHVFSPYCARLLGFENFNNKKALVLEYIKGVSLSQLIENFSLNSKEIQHILYSIYKGLEDLNKQGFCHGDLSLDNILIDEKAHIKLIDFGKANYKLGAQGTPPFLAPEIYKGAKANFLSDLYSLGVIEAVLHKPYPLSSLKDMKLEDFESDSPLLSSDPHQRFFSYETQKKPIDKSDLKSLSYKVKDLLSFMESRRCETLKNPVPKPPLVFNFIKSFALILIFMFAGMAGSQSYWPSHSLVKIYTNEWFKIRVGGFESYTPLILPLETGWHFIEWKNKNSQGKTKIFVSRGKELFLNDKSFLIKKSDP